MPFAIMQVTCKQTYRTQLLLNQCSQHTKQLIIWMIMYRVSKHLLMMQAQLPVFRKRAQSKAACNHHLHKNSQRWSSPNLLVHIKASNNCNLAQTVQHMRRQDMKSKAMRMHAPMMVKISRMISKGQQRSTKTLKCNASRPLKRHTTFPQM